MKQMKLNMVCEFQLLRSEVNQLAILQGWPRISTWDCREQIQLAVREGIELKALGLQVKLLNCSAMLPPMLTTFSYALIMILK